MLSSLHRSPDAERENISPRITSSSASMLSCAGTRLILHDEIERSKRGKKVYCKGGQRLVFRDHKSSYGILWLARTALQNAFRYFQNYGHFGPHDVSDITSHPDIYDLHPSHLVQEPAEEERMCCLYVGGFNKSDGEENK